jgi:hypothetical protein
MSHTPVMSQPVNIKILYTPGQVLSYFGGIEGPLTSHILQQCRAGGGKQKQQSYQLGSKEELNAE